MSEPSEKPSLVTFLLPKKYLGLQSFHGQPLFFFFFLRSFFLFLKGDLEKDLCGYKKHKTIQTNFSEKRRSDSTYIL